MFLLISKLIKQDIENGLNIVWRIRKEKEKWQTKILSGAGIWTPDSKTICVNLIKSENKLMKECSHAGV